MAPVSKVSRMISQSVRRKVLILNEGASRRLAGVLVSEPEIQYLLSFSEARPERNFAARLRRNPDGKEKLKFQNLDRAYQ